jgi:predicted ester cyclase
MSQANIETARRVIEEAFGGGKLEILDEVCAEGFVDHDPIQGDQDLEGVKRTIGGYREAFPDLTFTIEEIFAADDKVVTRWRAEGTFENEFMGQQPTHEKGDPVTGIGIDRFDADGKIVEAWGQWDVLTFMRDIGMFPEAVQATARA